MPDLWSIIGSDIARASGTPFSVSSRRAVGGGCINQAWLVEDAGRRWFVKLNQASAADMFAAEAEGLADIAATGTVTVPHPLCRGTAGDSAYLVLEFLQLHSGGGAAARELGHQLAAMHRAVGPSFGWRMDNTIGSTPQLNGGCDDWLEFWHRRRLGYQLELAGRGGHGRVLAGGERLLEVLPAFFRSYAPVPSLLHGDLWAGNWAVDARGAPVVFDPAVYYGDRETDIAMTELFGGFGGEFYAAYREAYPLDEGYGVRRSLYNLYHILNHLNLFGGAYLSRARELLAGLLAEAG